MISEKFVPQSYETACLNLLLDCQDLLEDLVVDIVDQLGRLVPEVQLEILESREKLDKEVSQDYQVCICSILSLNQGVSKSWNQKISNILHGVSIFRLFLKSKSKILFICATLCVWEGLGWVG